MLRLSGAFLLIALTCCHASAGVVDSSSYARSWTLPKDGPRTLIQGTLFTTDVNTFPYAICEFTKPNEERVCNVTLVRPNKQDSGICRVKIFANSKDKELFYNGYFQMIPFAREHVAVIWYDQTKEPANAVEKKYDFKISILDTSNCKTAHLDFPIQKVHYGFFPALVTYDNQIDVVVNSIQACGGVDRCKLSFDLQGKQIGDVQPYKPKLSGYANAVSPATPVKGFFQDVKNLSSIRVLFVNAEGEGKEVLNVKFDEQKQNKRDAYSNAHELYSICWTPTISTTKPTKISCSQFDATGNAKVSKEITFPQLLNWAAVHNLPKGGLLLATGGCEQAGSEECKTFRVHKINELGQEKPYEFQAPDLQCHDITSNLEVRISENDRDEVCFDFSCLSSSTNLKFVSTCVEKTRLN
ncbi:uncharacterized protein LOC100680003 [Nasonia vitripennis]|uniref:Uncharacterized protein n=1 Tax=Nasonia vitripennis TaxID=7425 RepID=A0A7M7ISB9_NASVI|nr:uncharacterized protein LOC100680003 [Nasonia vitripennis]XP_016840963.1 uncharacterized protein LOC100680003 [Nasonia vitripennis]